MKFVHVVSVSSGKDSQATMLLAIAKRGRENCRFVFCDTGNEDAAVFEHLDYLRQTLDVKIDVLRADFSEQIAAKRAFIANDQRVGRRNGRRIRWTNKAKRRALSVLHPTGNPFLDLCLWKGRFPARVRQFCTSELKTFLLAEYQLAIVDSGFGVISWQGVRRDESAKRSKAKKFSRIGPRMWAFRPIVAWTAQQTVDFIRQQGLRLNRLYSEGFDRVGCMPCINCGKKEINNIALRKPEEIDRLAEWERLVDLASKRGGASFFANPDREAHLDKRGIHKMVRWAKTSYGGKFIQPTQLSLIDEEASADACSSSYGLCDKP